MQSHILYNNNQNKITLKKYQIKIIHAIIFLASVMIINKISLKKSNYKKETIPAKKFKKISTLMRQIYCKRIRILFSPKKIKNFKKKLFQNLR